MKPLLCHFCKYLSLIGLSNEDDQEKCEQHNSCENPENIGMFIQVSIQCMLYNYILLPCLVSDLNEQNEQAIETQDFAALVENSSDSTMVLPQQSTEALQDVPPFEECETLSENEIDSVVTQNLVFEVCFS